MERRRERISWKSSVVVVPVEISSIQIGTESCSIREGNVFGQ
jgi:hypothetical protein